MDYDGYLDELSDDSYEQLREAVQRGIKWADENLADWDKKINLQYLDMYEGDRCILGQCCGSYLKTIDKFDIDPEYLGFSADTLTDYDENIVSVYSELTFLWSEEIERRRYARA